MFRRLLLPVIAALTVAACQTQVPTAAFTDPPRDAAHPARLEVLHIPSAGLEINGVARLALQAKIITWLQMLPKAN